MDFVKRNVGAIAYVNVFAVEPGVRALAIGSKGRWVRPGDSGYPLHY